MFFTGVIYYFCSVLLGEECVWGKKDCQDERRLQKYIQYQENRKTYPECYLNTPTQSGMCCPIQNTASGPLPSHQSDHLAWDTTLCQVTLLIRRNSSLSWITLHIRRDVSLSWLSLHIRMGYSLFWITFHIRRDSSLSWITCSIRRDSSLS